MAQATMRLRKEQRKDDAAVDDEKTRLLLHQRWMRLTSTLTNDEVKQRWWNEINNEYGGSSRRYHSLNHLTQMFHEVDIHRPNFKNPVAVEFAVFFHDLIYNARSGTNEEDSVERFKIFGQEAALPNEVIDLVVNYILLTKAHQVGPENPDVDLKLFIDIDMSVLGQMQEGYMKYASQVRQEYIHVPHDVYCSKRAEVLTSFLAHSRIYASTYYHDKLEARARSNIATEIEMLWKGIIPHQESHQGS